jgi:ubiquinone/menaquinone biosynthesis C-methylase UbiE
MKPLHSLRLRLCNKWSRSNIDNILSMLERDPKARVLDLGCGDGELTARVAAAVGTKEVVGVDVDKESLEKARARGIITVKHDLNKFPYPFETNSFDVVVSRHPKPGRGSKYLYQR